MMEPVIKPFNDVLNTIRFGESKIPIVSSTTGRWVSQDDLSSAGYWADQIRSTVNFSDGIQELLKPGDSYFIEVGPGNSLATLLSHYGSNGDKIDFISTMRHPKRKQNDVSVFLRAVAHAWVSGADIDWSSFYKDEKRYRVPLPGYPFDRERHWIDPVTPFNYFSESETKRVMISSGDDKAEFIMNDTGENQNNLHDRPLMANDYTPPVSETESLVVKIWEELLGIRGIGLDDDFFFLGGHSLLASQVINRISGEFNITLPLETLFSTPTIKGLVAKIESTIPTAAARDPEKVTHDPDGILPVSFDQKRLWIINQIDRNNPAYNIPFTYRLKGKLDKKLFVKSLNILFQRQSILRSSIKSVEGEPYCIIHNYESIPVSYPDFSGYSADLVESEIQKFFSHESRESFDIEEGPLFRIYLAKISDTETIFHMTVQHMVFDGWSWGIFAGELRQIYNNLLVNSGVTPEPLKYQYYDLASWQEKNIDESGLNDLVDYWKAQLKDSPSEINFPYDRRRKKTQSGLGRRQPIKLSAEISNKLKSLGQSENATVFMTLLSAFGLLLNKYSGDNDICIGAPTANRDNLNLEGIIGLFVNTIVLRLRFNDKHSFRDLLRITRETTLEALTHKNMPFEKLVEMLHPDRKTNINPIAQILFAYQNTPRPPLLLKGIEPERVLIKETISPFDMTLYAWEENGIIEGELEYSTDILEPDTIIRLTENFENLLNQIIKEPDVPASRLSLLSENEIRRIESFRGISTEYPKDKTLVQLFQEQAQLYPDKKAVIYNKVKYTYRELDERSDKLAETLIDMGVRSNAPVAILTDKSAEMIVGILAILKAGGGYVPIDPEYPQQRIGFMIKDSECKVVVLQDKYMDIPIRGVKMVSLDSPASYVSKKHSAIGPGSSSDLAYIMYTSGTTGKPKGSLILQYSVVRL
ncbi:MAG: condensation domain-containing protein, partial [Bacteroidales bacterium]